MEYGVILVKDTRSTEDKNRSELKYIFIHCSEFCSWNFYLWLTNHNLKAVPTIVVFDCEVASATIVLLSKIMKPTTLYVSTEHQLNSKNNRD